MAEDIAYADLNIQEIYAFPTAPRPCPASSTPQGTQRHRVALGVASALILLVSGVLITLASWVLQTKATLNGTNKCPPESAFRQQLKYFACNSPGNSTKDDAKDCKICPKAWNLHRDKCYWISEEQKTWDKSREDCRVKNSTLLVIQNMEEMAFMKNIENIIDKTANAFWLGLTVNNSEAWQWVDGSLLKADLLDVPKQRLVQFLGVKYHEMFFQMLPIKLC